MSATIATFNAILKEFYLGGVIDALNNEVHVLQHFEKASLDWNGRSAIIPIHTARNNAVTYLAEGAAFPPAGQQGYGRLQVTARYQYGRFQVSGPAIASARSGGRGSFIGWMDAEMNGLKDDVRDSANRALCSGGYVKGFIHQRLSTAALGPLPAAGGTGGVTAGAMTAGGGNIITIENLEYSGDYSVFETGSPVALGGNGATNQGDITTWIPVVLYRTDTGNRHWFDLGGAGATSVQLFVSAFDATAGTISITWGSFTAAGASWSSVVKPGYCLALTIQPAQAIDGAAAPMGVDTALLNFLQEPVGIFGNLAAGQRESVGGTPAAAPSHFSLTTNSGMSDGEQLYPAGTAPIVRGIVQSAVVGDALVGVNVGTSDQNRAALSLPRMQQMIDRTKIRGEVVQQTATDGHLGGLAGPAGATVDGGGGDVNLMFMHPLMRQNYVALLQGNLSMVVNAGSAAGPTKKADAGILNVSYAGIQIAVSRDVPNGLICFLRKDMWNLTELESGKFADLDGNVISRTAGQDNWEGFYKWYYNLVCKKPNDNVICTGFAL
tara:strand:+ start:241 stop:1893 length:1653 start_codon:yes stop_codon:yes gene_type:complete